MSRRYVQGEGWSASGTLNKGGVAAYPFTLACWLYTTNGATSQRYVGLHDGTNAHYIGWSGDSSIFVESNGNISSGAPASAADANTWVHATGVFAAANRREIYINGIFRAQQTGSVAMPNPLRNVLLGMRLDTGRQMDGMVQHVAIWDTALTANEIALLGAGRVSPLHIRPRSLIAYYPQCGLHGGVEIDAVGDNTLTVSGAVFDQREPHVQAKRRAPTRVMSAGGGGTIVTDDFNRSSGDDLGSNWAVTSGLFNINASGEVSGESTGECFAAWNGGETFSADQYAEMDLASVLGGVDYVGVGVRCSATEATGVFARKQGSDTNADGSAVNLHVWNAGTRVYNTSTAISSANSPQGSRLRLEVEGTVVRVLINGVERFTVTNPTGLPAAGAPGIAAFRATNTTRGDNWEGGDLGAVPVGTNGNASGEIGAVTVSPAEGSATGTASASGAVGALTIFTPTGAATGDANASGEIGVASTVMPPEASAIGAASGAGALSTVSITAPEASGHGDAGASGSMGTITLTAPNATGTAEDGSAFAQGDIGTLTVSAPEASGSGGASASGAISGGVAMSAPLGTAGGSAGASGQIGTISCVPPTGTATGTASATGAIGTISLVAPGATARDGNGYAFGALPTITILPPSGFARMQWVAEEPDSKIWVESTVPVAVWTPAPTGTDEWTREG